MGQLRRILQMTIVPILIFGIALLVGYGCKGDTGPVGPRGATGNANVMVDTFSLSSADWAYGAIYWFSMNGSTAVGWVTRYHDRADSAMITQGILDSGMVLVYFTPYVTHPDEWVSLPFSFLNSFGGYYFNFAYETSVGNVRLHTFFNPQDAGSTPPTLSTYTFPTYRFKIIAIAGQLKSEMAHAGVDGKNYNAVMNYLQRSQPDTR